MYKKLTAGLISMVVLIAAIELAGGPGGGDPPGPSSLVNLGVVQSGTCDSTPTREATAVELAELPDTAMGCTVAQTTSAANSGDKIGLETGEHTGPVAWGDGTKVLEYVGADGAWVNVGSTIPNYGGFQFNDNATVTNVDVDGDYTIVGMYGSTIMWQDSTLRSGEIRACNADEPILIEGGSDVAYEISNVVLRRIVVEQQRGQQGGCPGDGNFHLEYVRIGKAVENVTIEQSVFADCPDGSGFVGCGTSHIFITTTAPGLLEPRNIVIQNSKFGSAPNATIKVHPNVTPCDFTIAYNSTETETLVLNDSSACSGSTLELTGNAGVKGSATCFSGVVFVKNIWTPGTGGDCGSDTRTADLELDAGLNPEVGSPVIDAGETPGASDYCTGGLGSLDINGDSRPLGGICDAGAVEVS